MLNARRTSSYTKRAGHAKMRSRENDTHMYCSPPPHNFGFWIDHDLRCPKHCRHRLNSLTPKCVLAGTKNSRSEDFLLAIHTSHKHHSPPWWAIILSSGMVLMDEHTTPREPLRKELDEATVEGFSINYYESGNNRHRTFYFLTISYRLPTDFPYFTSFA